MTLATEIKEHPIIFSPPMIRAIIEGRKTQTRRILKPQPRNVGGCYARPDGRFIWTHLPVGIGVGVALPFPCPKGNAGDRLWVKESFYIDHVDFSDGGSLAGERPAHIDDDMIYYPADARQDGKWCCQLIPECCCGEVGEPKKRSSYFMPRWASRITLEIESVRVQRLQEISEADAVAVAEGMQEPSLRELGADLAQGAWSELHVFQRLWNHINGKKPGCSWQDNPWVWAIGFKVIAAMHGQA